MTETPNKGMAICAKCKWLAKPSKPEHAEHYYLCSWPGPVPIWMRRFAVCHVREESPSRWVTKKVVHELGHQRQDCETFEEGENILTSTASEADT